MWKGFPGALALLAIGLACDGGALQPGDPGTGGGGPAGTSAAAGTGGGGAAGMAGAAGTAAAPGGTGGSLPPPTSCTSISTEIRQFNPCGRTYSLAYSPDGALLAAGMEGPRPNVRLWRLTDGVLVRDMDGAGGVTYDVAFSPDGNLLAAAGGYEISGALSGLPEIVKIWNVADGSLARTIPATCGHYADTVTFSHDGTLLATGGYRGAVEVWRVADASLVASIVIQTSVHNVHFSPDDTKLIIGSVDQRATVWSLPAGGLMLTLPGIADEMADADFSPDAREIATTGANNAVVVWSATTGAVLQTLPGHQTFVSHVLWAGPDRLISNDWNGEVRTWTRMGGDFSQTAKLTLAGQSLGIALSPDQTTAAVGGMDPNGAEGFVFYRP